MPRRDTLLCAGEHYHLYNLGNNRGRVFFERDNYLFFLRRVREYPVPVGELAAYCLMPTQHRPRCRRASRPRDALGKWFRLT